MAEKSLSGQGETGALSPEKSSVRAGRKVEKHFAPEITKAKALLGPKDTPGADNKAGIQTIAAASVDQQFSALPKSQDRSAEVAGSQQGGAVAVATEVAPPSRQDTSNDGSGSENNDSKDKRSGAPSARRGVGQPPMRPPRRRDEVRPTGGRPPTRPDGQQSPSSLPLDARLRQDRYDAMMRGEQVPDLDSRPGPILEAGGTPITPTSENPVITSPTPEAGTGTPTKPDAADPKKPFDITTASAAEIAEYQNQNSKPPNEVRRDALIAMFNDGNLTDPVLQRELGDLNRLHQLEEKNSNKVALTSAEQQDYADLTSRFPTSKDTEAAAPAKTELELFDEKNEALVDSAEADLKAGREIKPETIEAMIEANSQRIALEARSAVPDQDARERAKNAAKGGESKSGREFYNKIQGMLQEIATNREKIKNLASSTIPTLRARIKGLQQEAKRMSRNDNNLEARQRIYLQIANVKGQLIGMAGEGNRLVAKNLALEQNIRKITGVSSGITAVTDMFYYSIRRFSRNMRARANEYLEEQGIEQNGSGATVN